MAKNITIITHSGSFHPDDCFAVASLLLYLERQPLPVSVIRTRDEKVIETGDFVVDVGGKYEESKERFDHHQPGGAGVRENGVPYASFGLVWKKYGEAISGSAYAAKEIEDRLVLSIDALDNGVDILNSSLGGVKPFLVTQVIFSYLPTWRSAKSADSAFQGAISFARDLLEREIYILKDKEAGNREVEKAYAEAKDKRIIVLGETYMWADILSEKKEPLLVIYPDDGKYHVKTVRSNPATFESRILFPENWAGLRGKELAEASGVPDAIFCHNKRFLSVAETLDGAMALAAKALQAWNKKK